MLLLCYLFWYCMYTVHCYVTCFVTVYYTPVFCVRTPYNWKMCIAVLLVLLLYMYNTPLIFVLFCFLRTPYTWNCALLCYLFCFCIPACILCEDTLHLKSAHCCATRFVTLYYTPAFCVSTPCNWKVRIAVLLVLLLYTLALWVRTPSNQKGGIAQLLVCYIVAFILCDDTLQLVNTHCSDTYLLQYAGFHFMWGHPPTWKCALLCYTCLLLYVGFHFVWRHPPTWKCALLCYLFVTVYVSFHEDTLELVNTHWSCTCFLCRLSFCLRTTSNWKVRIALLFVCYSIKKRTFLLSPFITRPLHFVWQLENSTFNGKCSSKCRGYKVCTSTIRIMNAYIHNFLDCIIVKNAHTLLIRFQEWS